MTTLLADGKPMLILSDKFKDFLKVDVPREYLEGVTACGKTTVGIFKFMCKVIASPVRFHVIAGADLGTVEKNVINPERGLLDQFRMITNYWPKGHGKIGLPHVEVFTKQGIKIIYVCGYDNKTRWKKVLGGQVGCVYIDEINIADMEFLREITHRCRYMMTTSNPDDPNLPVYSEFLNRSRPLKRYMDDYPPELLAELNEPPVKGWIHWYFNFNDNAALTAEEIETKKNSVAPGTKMYKNKILGLRGRATGLVFNLEKKHIITPSEAMEKEYVQFCAAVDTSYSRKSDDTIAFKFGGITKDRAFVALAEEIHNNKDRVARGLNALAPSDIPALLVSFLEQNRKRWVDHGDAFARDVYIDSADQATFTECEKYNRQIGSLYSFYPSWKRLPVLDRIYLQIGWMAQGYYFIVDECSNSIREMNSYSWQEDKKLPEDANDHTINADQYSWMPYKHMIGIPDGKEG